MIISHRHQYIFFAIPKTGTHSVRQALRKSMGEDDVEQVRLNDHKVMPYPEIARIPHGHISARQIHPVLGDEIYARYKKFAFVRNPFDRFVSCCAFESAELNPNPFLSQPTRFMKHVMRVVRPFNHVLFHPQYTFVTDASGALNLDLVGHTETMQSSFDQICDSIGLERVQLAQTNTSEHKPYQEYYDNELVDLVADQYRKDLELFGYQF